MRAMTVGLGTVGRSAAGKLASGGITSWTDALDRQPGDIKVVVDVTA